MVILCLSPPAAVPGQGEPIEPEIVTTLSLDDARQLVTQRRHLRLPRLETLTPEVAAVLAERSSTIDLPALGSLTPEVAAGLVNARRYYGLVLDGVRRLAPATARVLARHEGELRLAGLEDLPPEVASEFGRCSGHLVRLAVPLPAAPDDATLRGLAAAGHDIEITGPVTVTPALATAFAAHRKYLTLSGPVAPIAPAVARQLTFPGPLHIPGPITLDDKAATILGTRRGDLWITGFTSISPAIARMLASRPETISLPLLRELDADVAAIIAASARPRIELAGLETLSVETARALAGFGGLLYLSGLKRMSPDVATAFADHSSWLDLPGLETLEPEVAAALARHAPPLCLDGLVRLSPAAAEGLAAHPGKLSLKGIRSLTDRNDTLVAAALAKKRGPLALPSLARISAPALTALAEHPDLDIPPLDALDVTTGPAGESADDLILPEKYLDRQPRRTDP